MDDKKAIEKISIPILRIDNFLRKIVLVSVPNYEKDFGYPVKRQAFYESTGVSNNNAFTSVFFPMQGVNTEEIEDLNKLNYLKGRGSYAFNFLIKMDAYYRDRIWMQAYCEKMDNFLTVTGQRLSCVEHYTPILSMFSYWWQLRISALLGGEFWDRPDMIYLRAFAMLYKWNHIDQKFEMDEFHHTYDTSKYVIISQGKNDEEKSVFVNNELKKFDALISNEWSYKNFKLRMYEEKIRELKNTNEYY